MKKKKFNLTAFLFVAPNFIGFIIFILLPILFSLVISFTDFNIFKGIQGMSFVGLENFFEMFTDQWFLSAIWNNLKYTLITIPALICLAMVLAVLLNDKVYGKNALRAAIFIPYITSIVAVSSVWLMLFNPSQGVINNFLRSIGIENVPSWLGSPHWSLPSVMIVGIWVGLGYNTIVYMAGLQSIDKTLYEAADIDGANSVQQFFHVTAPMLTSTTFFLMITNVIASFQVFGTINIMTNGGPGRSSTVLAHYIYLAGFRYHKMGYAASMAWFLLLFILFVTIVQWKFQRRFEDDM